MAHMASLPHLLTLTLVPPRFQCPILAPQGRGFRVGHSSPKRYSRRYFLFSVAPKTIPPCADEPPSCSSGSALPPPNRLAPHPLSDISFSANVPDQTRRDL